MNVALMNDFTDNYITDLSIGPGGLTGSLIDSAVIVVIVVRYSFGVRHLWTCKRCFYDGRSCLVLALYLSHVSQR